MREISTEHLVIHYSSNSYLISNIQKLSTRLTTNLQQAENILGKRLEKPLQVYLFGSWEEKGNYTNDIRIANAVDLSIFCIVNEHWDGLAERTEFQVLLNQFYGNAFRPEWNDFVASALGGVWFQKTLDDWTTFLLSRNLNPEFPSLISDQQTSRFIRYPWNALLVRFIKQQYGLPAMIHLYKSGELPPDYPQRWQKWISSIAVKTNRPYKFIPEFQKGMTYAYWNSYDGGYPTQKSDQSLKELQAIGVNWIAAVPYGFMQSDQHSVINYAGHHIAGESDESLWALAENAKRRGIKIMLKPQLWIHHASWPGKIDFQTKAEWDDWMNQYEKWILHYAIIAELTKTDLFCIGTELVQATLKNPERWRTLIQRVRRVYHGPITYAANWGKEFEGLSFWDSMDYLGVDNYYPVRKNDNQGLSQMKAGFASQKEMLKSYVLRYRKPLLFTEIGYMANSKAGMGPAEFEADPDDYNEPYQEACYRMALETYWNEPWFAGMYWWKWFSSPEDRGKSADAHSPHGRAAENTLKQWYEKQKSMK
jgi:hypothetical protein